MTAPAITPFSKARIEALSDGVFAIAMTLLVLEIKVPELPRDVAPAELWHATIEHWPIFFSFLVTFMLAGQFWLSHHVLSLHAARRSRSCAAYGGVPHVRVAAAVFHGDAGGVHAAAAGLARALLRQPARSWRDAQRQVVYSRRCGLLAIEPHDPVATRFQFQMLGHPVSCVVALLTVAIDPILSFRAFVITFILVTVVAARRGKAAAALRPSQS